MAERIKQIPKKLLEIWNNWTKKQKTVIVSAVAVFLVAVVILAVVLNQPNYQVLTTCKDYTELSEVTALLKSNSYDYKVADNSLIVQVPKAKLTDAKMLIASENIQSDGYSFDDAMNSSFTTTESDKTKKYAHYLESKLKSDLESMDGIKNATVNIQLADSTNSFYTATSDASVGVTLKLSKTMEDEKAESIANFLATSVGNTNTDNITILSSDGSTLYSGANNSTVSGVSYNSKLKYKERIENTTKNSLRQGLLATGLYDDAYITMNLVLDWDAVNTIAKQYTPADGQEQGLYSESYDETSVGTNGASGTPGTTSNDDTTYEVTDGTSSTSTYEVHKYAYLPNELVTTTTKEPGSIVTEEKYDNIIALIKNVSEIKDAAGQEITQPFPEEQTEEAKEEKKETSAVSQTAKPAAAKPAAKKPTSTGKTSGSVSHTVRVDIEKLDVLMNLVSELIIAKNGLVSASHVEGDEAAALNQSFTEQIEYLERVTTNLHESVMKVRMMPIESVFSRFPRMIRDLNKKLGKKMELYMSGEDTELDRTVIDEIGDPIMHLLRNSADHGLESAEIRKERGKSEVGSIFLDAFQEGNNVVIEVRDDGNGIDTEKVKAKAVEKGTITQEQADVMTDKEAIDLLFRPSFSTAEKVTDVSGRGVGLDVVKSKIEALGGDVEVKTKYGEGSTFSIRLPLTLAIIQALMVKLGDEKYAISLGSIETIEDIPVSDIKYVHAKEVIHLRGNVIPLIRLRDLLDVPGEPEESENITVVVVRKGDKQAGLVVDSLIGQMEIVIKSLGKYIRINKMISGATILGDGSVALIIDANTLV